jgi:ankyrin repeat protein
MIVSVEEFLAAVEKGETATVRHHLTADPSLVSARNPEGVSAIAIAAYWSRGEVLSMLLEAVPDLDLWEASITGNVDRIRDLVEQDPGLTGERSPDGFTALHLATFFGHEAAARFLVDRGADVLARTSNALANQPIHAAVAGSDAEGRLACARVLLDAGALPNELQSGGFTPLMSAAQNGDRALVDLLLDRGADPSLRDDEGRSAADHARAAGHDDIAVLLTPDP